MHRRVRFCRLPQLESIQWCQFEPLLKKAALNPIKLADSCNTVLAINQETCQAHPVNYVQNCNNHSIPAGYAEPATPKTITSQQDYSSLNIVTATQNGILERCKELIEAGYDVNKPDDENVSLLHWAAINNRKDVMQYYISKGALVDYVGGDLMATPLHWATRGGYLAAVVLLMRHGADPLTKDVYGMSCIHVAAELGFAGIVAYFIAKGVDVNLQDRNGLTPLMWSAHKITSFHPCDSADPTRMLLTFGACTSILDFHGANTALHFAIMARNVSAVSILILHDASLNITNREGKTPLQMMNECKLNLAPNVVEKINSVVNVGPRHGSFLQRLTDDKQMRHWATMMTPVVAFYLVGQLLASSLFFPLKVLIVVMGFLCIYYLQPYLCVERPREVLFIATYFATKLWVYVTWLVWFTPHVSLGLTIAMLISSGLLWYNFLRVWKGDPGTITATKEERYRTIIEEAERGGFDLQWFCASCLVRRPIRSKHCAICNKCIAKHDHHCPWVDNCVGGKNHRSFIGYLTMLLVMSLFTIYGTTQYYKSACPVHQPGNFFDEMLQAAQCDTWVMWVAFNVSIHVTWVFLLLGCQMYQIVILGMTTNERINHYRYSHFHQGGVTRNPFHRGYFQNLVDFLGWRCLGLLHPDQTDWSTRFHAERGVEHLPLLTTKDNHQYV